MQPTPPHEDAHGERLRDLADTPERPEEERLEAQQQAQEDAVEVDEPRKRGWRFWRRKYN